MFHYSALPGYPFSVHIRQVPTGNTNSLALDLPFSTTAGEGHLPFPRRAAPTMNTNAIPNRWAFHKFASHIFVKSEKT